jgi:hypothetical protein
MMNRRTLAVVCTILFWSSLPVSAAETTPPLEVKDALALTTKAEVFDATLDRIDSLGRLLAKVTDEKSAAELRPAIERCYLEMELLGSRLTMMGPPTDEDRRVLASTQARFVRGKEKVQSEMTRIASNSAAANTLRSVVLPVIGQLRGDADTKLRTTVSILQTLRSQIELYKLQHLDTLPDFRHHGWQQLTHKTNERGEVSDSAKFGAYLASSPRNPYNGSSKLLLIKGKPKADFHYDKGDIGFVLDETSDMIWALDASGGILNESPSAAAAAD